MSTVQLSGGADDPDAIEPISDDVALTPPSPGQRLDAAQAAIEAMADDEDDAPPIRRRSPMTPGEKSADSMLMSSAASRRIAREKATDEALGNTVRSFMANESSGYFDVERIGPAGLPESERGVLGEIRFIELTGENSSVSAIVSQRWGGGHYMLTPKRSDNSVAEVNPVRLKVAGDPIPVSDIGRAWLANARKRGKIEEDYSRPERDGGGEQSGQMFALMLKMMETAEERARMDREREREERRRDEERREKEKAREAEAAAARERERIADEKARRAQEREDAEARRQQEMELFESRMASQLKMVEAEATARLKAIEAQADLNQKRAEANLKIEMMRAESQATSGLGLEGLGKLRGMLSEAIGKKTIEDLGLASEDEDNSFAGIMGNAAKEVLPDLFRTAGETLLPRLAAMIPDRGGGAPANALPHPPQVAALPGPEPVEPGAEEPAPAAPAPAAPGAIPPAPSAEVRKRQAQIVAVRAVLGFARPLSVLVLSRPAPAAAWDEEVAPDRTLGDVYGSMPEQARAALAGEDGWSKFVAMLGRFAPDDAAALTEGVADESGPAWVAGFLAAGPWHDDEPEAAEAAPESEP